MAAVSGHPPDITKEIRMRCMAIIKASPESEAGILPSERQLTAMGAFNQELLNAGVLLGGEGLHPSARGLRLQLDAHGSRVTSGPFAATGELIAGFWLLQVNSLDDAVAWLKRMPNPDNAPIEIELRPVFEAEDFGTAFTAEARALEDALRQQLAH
ncbi:YciI family protein [Xanthomonas campestris pv. campestris]|nr:YciI family protein [Xanthomonas campestris pv. campestris]NWJ37548.1 YciI family protein [Xanthomonas campestris pv. campestris]WDI83808.1 YciI family protein [Xanthomonas campestris pv. campestris]WDJ13896.1 YciI family protein [Xanthomonas campestris pv. campestris]WDK57818.1 YciI family protein [Xanthomonas campestris pv. campestris]